MASTSDRGFTLIELLIVVTIISIMAGMSVPGLMRARMNAYETSAIGSLKVVSEAQIAYSASCGNGAYATSFVILGTPTGGTAAYISPDLGSSVAPKKSGYKYTLGAGAGSVAGPKDCLARATNTAFYASAVPQTYGTTGVRAFAINSGMTIYQMDSAVPISEPFATSGAVPIQ
jgi:prepilin-type N-terminal cleavage/methylation domain-containing protein